MLLLERCLSLEMLGLWAGFSEGFLETPYWKFRKLKFDIINMINGAVLQEKVTQRNIVYFYTIKDHASFIYIYIYIHTQALNSSLSSYKKEDCALVYSLSHSN